MTDKPKAFLDLPENENKVGYVHVPESTKTLEAHEKANDRTKLLNHGDAMDKYPAPDYMWVDEPKPDQVSDLPEAPVTFNEHIEEKINESISGIPDSGKRRPFSTGSVRDVRSGKGRFDLISPIALLSVAKRLEDGQDKYGERNWEKGQHLMSYLDSALRHIYTYISEVMKGEDEAEDHMGAAAWNIQCFIHTQEMIKVGLLPDELNDIPTPERVGLKRHFKPDWRKTDHDGCDCLGGLQGCDETDSSEGC